MIPLTQRGPGGFRPNDICTLLCCLAVTAGCRSSSDRAPSEVEADVPAVSSDEENETTEAEQANSAAAADSDATSPAPAAPASTAASSYAPLSPSVKARFFGSAEDPPAEILDAQLDHMEGRHFLFSDEEHPHKFYKKLRDLGGGFVGVGTDQCYLFIGWMKPTLAWLSDYDQWISFLHLAYFAFFEASDTPDAFFERWNPENEDQSIELLESAYADHEHKNSIVKVYKAAHERVMGRLNRLRRLLEEKQLPGFIADETSYRFVRELIMSGRVRPLIGNLLGDEGLQGIAAVSKQLDVPIRAIYLSNAESYWQYTEPFRQNMAAMNFDKRSIVLRTFASKPKNGDYCYNTQSAQNFIEWLNQPFVKNVRHIWQRNRIVKRPTHIPYSHIDRPPQRPER